VNAKCDVVMKLSVFGTQTHTHKLKPIHPRNAGCNSQLSSVFVQLVNDLTAAAYSKVTGYSSSPQASPLRELTCHMGSHSITCHQAEVTFPPLPQPVNMVQYNFVLVDH